MVPLFLLFSLAVIEVHDLDLCINPDINGIMSSMRFLREEERNDPIDQDR